MKKTITTITLAMVLTFGATFANANSGIIIGDANANGCTKTEKEGIIIGDIVGIIIGDIVGIIIGDKPAPCVEKDGIIYGG